MGVLISRVGGVDVDGCTGCWAGFDGDDDNKIDPLVGTGWWLIDKCGGGGEYPR